MADIRIGIAGFQSITKAVIDVPAKSVVGIVGENNLGKSAVIRAIKSLIQNSPDKDVINSRMSEAMVRLKTERGLYQWNRSPKTSQYMINKEVKEKLNRATLYDVEPSCGLIVEKEGADTLTPNVLSEGEKPFPFNLTPSVAFRLFSRFMSPPKLSQLAKELKSTIAENKTELNNARIAVDVQETEVSRVSEKLGSLPPLEKVRALKSLIADNTILMLKRDNTISNLTQIKAGLGGVAAELAKLPDKTRLDSLKNLINATSSLLNKRDNIEARFSDVVSGLSKVRTMLAECDAELVTALKARLAATRRDAEQLDRLPTALLNIKKIRKDKEYTNKAIDEIKGYIKNKNRLNNIKKKLDIINEFNVLTKDIRDSALSAHSLNGNLAVLLEERSKYKICPACSRPL